MAVADKKVAVKSGGTGLKLAAVDYCENTTVHGFSYWAKPGLRSGKRDKHVYTLRSFF